MSTTEPTTALTTISAQPLDDVERLATMLAKSRLLPPDLIGKEADIAVTVMAGHELGLAPMAALRGIHVVKGKPVLSADTMVAIALSSGAADYFTCIETTGRSATYETKRRGSPHPVRLTFTIEQAAAAGLNGGNWKAYPDAMLRARAKAALARDVYPDALAGCYEEGEIAELDRGAPAPVSTGPARPTVGDVIDAQASERVAAPAQAPQSKAAKAADLAVEVMADIEAAGDVDELRKVAPRVNALPKDTAERAQAKAAYLARMDVLTAPRAASADDGAAA